MNQHAAMAPPDGWFAEMSHLGGDTFLLLRIHPDLAVEYPPAYRHTDHVRALLEQWTDADGTTLMPAITGMRPGETGELEVKREDPVDGVRWVRAIVRCRQRDDGTVVVEGVLRDITARKTAEQALAQSERRHRLLAENAWDVVWSMALDGTITYVSPAVERVRGFTPEQARTQSLEQIHPPESAARVVAYFESLFAAIAECRTPPTFHGEQDYYRKDGSLMSGELQVIPHLDDQGRVIEILGVTRDISDRQRYEEELRRLADTDPLTGLINRRVGEYLLKQTVTVEEQPLPPACALIIDIDQFKAINDTRGHEAGDRVLRRVTEEFARATRVTDTLMRWGGDEFVILLPGCSREAGLRVAEEIRHRIEHLEDPDLPPLTVSVGVAQVSADDTATTWLERADAALYAAKQAGRNLVRG